MSTKDRTPSWRWAEDGDTVKGTVTGMRQVASKYRDGMVTVMDVDVPGVGVRTVWMDAKALRDYLADYSPAVGDSVVLQRVEKRAFTTKDGEERSMWIYHTEHRRQGEPSGEPFGDPLPPKAEDTFTDADIPF